MNTPDQERDPSYFSIKPNSPYQRNDLFLNVDDVTDRGSILIRFLKDGNVLKTQVLLSVIKNGYLNQAIYYVNICHYAFHI